MVVISYENISNKYKNLLLKLKGIEIIRLTLNNWLIDSGNIVL